MSQRAMKTLRSLNDMTPTFHACLSPIALRTGLVFSTALIGALGYAAPALAATINVTGLGNAVAADGQCTLREAIQAANTNTAVNECTAGDPGLDTIIIPAGTINVTGTALPSITEPVTISGAAPITGGTTATVIDYQNNNIGPGLFLEPGAAGSTVRNLTVQNVGTATSVAGGDRVNIRVQSPNTTFDNIITQNSLSGVNGSLDGAGILFDGNDGNNTAPFGTTNPQGSILRNSIIRNNAHAGVSIRFGTTNITVENNIISGNGTVNTESDGIEIILGSNNNLIQNNQIINNSGYGIDLLNNALNLPSIGNQIVNNIIQTNGFGSATQDAGIGIRLGQNTVIQNNVITGNDDDGIVVINGSIGNRITENSIFNNGTAGAAGQLAIDLGGGNQGNGITSNDDGDVDSVDNSNGLFNFPVFEGAIIAGNQLILPGFARPGAIIELFVVSTPDPNNFGEAEFYLDTLTEGGGADTNGGTGAYGPTGGAGVTDTRLAYGNATAALLGNDNNANRFLFNLTTLPTLQTRTNLTAITPSLTPTTFTPGARNNTPLQIGDVVTATATSTSLASGGAVNSTSELSGLITVTAGIGVSKEVTAQTLVSPGVFDVTFRVSIENLSPIQLNDVQVTDNLATTFAGATSFAVQGTPTIVAADTEGTGSAGIATDDTTATANGGFNGTADINLLGAGARLAPRNLSVAGDRSRITVEYTVRVTPGNVLAYENTAVGTGTINGTTTQLTDNSNDGGIISTGTDPTIDPNNTPTPINFGLELIKRITRIVRGGVTINFTTPTDNPPDNAFVGVTTPPAPNNELASGDQVEYTIYYINRTANPFTAVSICDPVPANTTFVPDGFAAGQGIQYAAPAAALGAAVNQTNAIDADQGAFLAALTANGACPGGNAGNLGAAFADVGTVGVGERGLVRFVTTVD